MGERETTNRTFYSQRLMACQPHLVTKLRGMVIGLMSLLSSVQQIMRVRKDGLTPSARDFQAQITIPRKDCHTYMPRDGMLNAPRLPAQRTSMAITYMAMISIEKPAGHHLVSTASSSFSKAVYSQTFSLCCHSRACCILPFHQRSKAL